MHPNLTLNVGVRWDYWWNKAFVRGVGTTFDLATGQSVAGENSQGQVDLTAQPISPYFAAATPGLWISAAQAGMDPGLFKHSGYVSPRVGFAWRPFGKDTFVVRGGYGIFASSLYGNATGSSVTGPPYWAAQTSHSRKHPINVGRRRFRTPFRLLDYAECRFSRVQRRADESTAVQSFGSEDDSLASIGRDRLLCRQPWLGSYRIAQDQHRASRELHQPAGGDAVSEFGTINLYESLGHDWYNSLQTKFEKRFSQGLTYVFSYAFSRDISRIRLGNDRSPTLYAPLNYDEGISPNERRHILTVSGIYELPYGRGKRFGNHIHPVLNAVLGGWQLSGLYPFTSGSPLTPAWTGATLGNGTNARPDIVGDPQLGESDRDSLVQPDAFAKPANYTFGNSAPGSIIGPSSTSSIPVS